jgi:hypothetical protein
MHHFKAEVNMIGVNPFVYVPDIILRAIFKEAGRDKGHISIRGTINGKVYQQTLVKYSGDWRLYINTTMLKNSPKRIGETVDMTIEFDSTERTIETHPKLVKALEENTDAKRIFDSLPPSRKKEIIRYISFLKTEESVDKNVNRAIDFLLGKGRFLGRDKP